MSFIDRLKDRGAKMMGEVPAVRVTMMGPRAVGKTSIMASIFSETRQQVAGTQLYFVPVGATATALSSKRGLLQQIIEDRDPIQDQPATGAIAASSEVTTFNFEMGLKGRQKTVNVVIKDFPGEKLENAPEEVAGFIDESHVVMVAIDTPYLMEEGGRYNESKNEAQRVTDFFRRSSDQVRNKLVLLVPLKSERYFHEDRVEEVSQRVTEVYGPLIELFKRQNVACVVAPIQTLGGVEFDGFTANDTGLGSVPVLARYRFYGASPEYKPMFCIQPLYYLLTYVANYYEWEKGQAKGMLGRLMTALGSYLKDDDEFYHQIKVMAQKVLIDRMGYHVLCPNTVLNIK